MQGKARTASIFLFRERWTHLVHRTNAPPGALGQGDGTCQYYDSRYRQEKQEKAEANGFRFFSYSAGTEAPSSVTTIQLSSVVRS